MKDLKGENGFQYAEMDLKNINGSDIPFCKDCKYADIAEEKEPCISCDALKFHSHKKLRLYFQQIEGGREQPC